MSNKSDKKGKHLLGKDAEIIPGTFNITPEGLLTEEVPNFQQLSNELIIKPEHDNNAQIRLGRDRLSDRVLEDPARKEITAKDPMQRRAASGYSGYQGSGAIDIVVGRGAPWPFRLEEGEATQMPPHYTTKIYEGGVVKKLREGSPSQAEVDHPLIFMDAARIYMSQMCKPDLYFKIKNPTGSSTIDKNPCSAIVIKGDKLRMHARRDIKIVAGGDLGDKRAAKIDSNGYPIRDDQGRIYLMKNEQASCSPAVRGREMVACVKDILNTQRNIIIMLSNMLFNQVELNAKFGTEFYVSPSGPTAFNPVSAEGMMKANLENVNNIFNTYFEGFYNISMSEMTYAEAAGANSILSKHVFIS